jgi:hypothetical protein
LLDSGFLLLFNIIRFIVEPVAKTTNIFKEQGRIFKLWQIPTNADTKRVFARSAATRNIAVRNVKQQGQKILPKLPAIVDIRAVRKANQKPMYLQAETRA